MQNLLKGLNVYLIGMMGTGKTTVGKILANQLKYRFFDTDTIIEAAKQSSISEIFATEGESEFRKLEGEVLKQLSAYTRSAIATGGGIVLRRMNWSYLHQGLVVWLDTPATTILQRLEADNTRPLLQTEDPAAKLKAILDERRPLYQQADLHIKITPQQTPDAIAAEIMAQIPSVIKPQSQSDYN